MVGQQKTSTIAQCSLRCAAAMQHSLAAVKQAGLVCLTQTVHIGGCLVWLATQVAAGIMLFETSHDRFYALKLLACILTLVGAYKAFFVVKRPGWAACLLVVALLAPFNANRAFPIVKLAGAILVLLSVVFLVVPVFKTKNVLAWDMTKATAGQMIRRPAILIPVTLVLVAFVCVVVWKTLHHFKIL